MSISIIPVPPRPTPSQNDAGHDQPESRNPQATSSGDSPFQQIVSSFTPKSASVHNSQTSTVAPNTATDSPKRPIPPKSPKFPDALGPYPNLPDQSIVSAPVPASIQTNNSTQSLPSAELIGENNAARGNEPSDGSALAGAIMTAIAPKPLVQALSNVDTQADTANNGNVGTSSISPSITAKVAGFLADEAANSKETDGLIARQESQTRESIATDRPNRLAAALKYESASPNNTNSNFEQSVQQGNDDGNAIGSGAPAVTKNVGFDSIEGVRRSDPNRTSDPAAVVHGEATGGSNTLTLFAADQGATSSALQLSRASGSPAVQSSPIAASGNSAVGSPSSAAAMQPRDVTWSDMVHGIASAAPGRLERDGQAEFRFRVSPPDMGEISIRLTAGRGGVTGEMTVGTSAVQQLVQSRLPELRQQLESAGVSVTSFNVTQQGGSSPDSRRQNPASWDTDGTVPLQPVSPMARTRALASSRGLVDVTV
jgi:flagellar hook-length control protein FliK